ncbi:MAG: serine/threonine-protein kinase [Phycisphaerales bacterium]
MGTDPTLLARAFERFHELADLPEGEASQQLEMIRATDPELARLLDDLLSRGGTDDGTIVDRIRHRLQPPPEAELLGADLGPYRIEEVIGEGAFGRVYRAQRRHPFDQEVAIKVLHRHVGSTTAAARFDQERQALARMDHPSIAKILDAGVTGDGRPYVVMEFLRGRPITAWARDDAPSLEHRLAVFIQACEAVQHAHQKGVLHRDISANNCLVVTSGDRHPLAKVIDFGISKILEEDTPGPFRTREGTPMGTPPYASPEVITGSRDVDTRADVYSLGAVLYELVTQCPLFPRERVTGASTWDLIQLITLEDPIKPSVRVGSAVDGSRTSRQLAGDLDWIVMKCLAKDRERRYDSAGELADDLRRHLRTEPVLAGPPTLGYRASKFFRKHRFGVGTAATASTLLLASLAGLTVLSVRLNAALRAESRAAEQAVEQQRVAEHRNEQLESALGFIDRMFKSLELQANTEAPMTVKKFADLLITELDTNPPSDGYAEFRARGAVSTLLSSRSLYSEAAKQVERALAAVEGDDSVSKIMRLKAAFDEWGSRFMIAGNAVEQSAALTKIRELAEQIDAIAPQEDPTGWDVLNEAATLVRWGGDAAAARTYSDRAFERQRLGNAPGYAVAYSHFNLMDLSGDDEPLQHGEEALRLFTESQEYGPDHPHTLIVQRDLGRALIARARKSPEHASDRDRGFAMMREAMERVRRVHGPEHPTTGEFAMILADELPPDDESRPDLYREALRAFLANPDARCDQNLGLGIHESLAQSLRAFQQYDAALDVYEEAVVLVDECLASGGGQKFVKEALLRSAAELAYEAATDTPTTERAVSWLERCATYQLQVLRPGHPAHKRYADPILNHLTDALARLGREADAAEWQTRYDQARTQG